MQRVAEAGQPVAHFRVTDGKASVDVAYAGILPDLFREGQGVVTLGTMRPDGTFRAARCWPSTTRPTCPRMWRTR